MFKLKDYFVNESAEPLLEKTGAKILRILAGDVPGINSYALMTAENPFGEEHGPRENEQYNKEFEHELRKHGLGYYKVRGKFFGNNEHSFLIPNASEDFVKDMGEKFGQESVIQGEKSVGETGAPVMLHKYITGNKVVKTRKSFKNLAHDLEDMYTQAKGKKFEIPFFDPKERGKELIKGKNVQATPKSDIDVDSPNVTVPNRTAQKNSFINDKTKLLNLNGREVWVNKDNEKNYIQQGYKQAKNDKRMDT